MSQIFVKIEFDPHLDLLDFFPSVKQVKVCEILLGRQFFIWKNLVIRVLKKILKRNWDKPSNSTC